MIVYIWALIQFISLHTNGGETNYTPTGGYTSTILVSTTGTQVGAVKSGPSGDYKIAVSSGAYPVSVAATAFVQ